jgi:hypothetical protein
MDSFATLVGNFGHLFPEFGCMDVGIIIDDDHVSFTSATPLRKSPCIGFFSQDGVEDRTDECMRSLIRFERRHEKTYANAVKPPAESPRKFALRYVWAAHAMRATYERLHEERFLEAAENYYIAAISMAAGEKVATQVADATKCGCVGNIACPMQYTRLLSDAFAGMCLVEAHRDSNEAALMFAATAVQLRPRAVALVNCARIVALAKGNHDLALRITGRVLLPLLSSTVRERELALWPPEMRIVLAYIERECYWSE